MKLYKADIKRYDNESGKVYIAKNIKRAILTETKVLEDCKRTGFHRIPFSLTYVIDIEFRTNDTLSKQIIPQIITYIRDKKIDELI